MMDKFPKKVLFHEGYFSEFKGVQRVLYHFLQLLDRGLFQPLVVTPAEGIFARKIRELDIEVLIIPLPPELMRFGKAVLSDPLPKKAMSFLKLVPYTQTMARLIRSYEIDIMYPSTLRSVLTNAWSAKLTGIPVVWPIRRARYFGLSDQLAYLLSDVIIASSEGAKAVFCCHPPFKGSSKIVTIYDGLIMDEWHPDLDIRPIREEFGFSTEEIVIGTVASLVPRKGLDFFIEMALDVSPRFPDLRFIIVGDTPSGFPRTYEEQIRALAQPLVVDGRLVFAGWRDDLERMYAMMDIFVLPSLIDALPHTVLEAMAMRKPVVMTNMPGVEEGMVDGQTGYVVPPKDGPALTLAVERLLTDDKLRERMGKAGRERVMAMFSHEITTRKTEQVFLECLSR